ncbi:MAG: GTP 3',8-cyclase MoaA [Anaerolineae bacterium]
MKDSFGREINYLRISLTDRCNLRCVYCMPLAGLTFAPNDDLLSPGEIEAVARAAVEVGFRKFRLTGGEPTLRRDLLQIVERLNAVEGVEQITMTTNGYRLPKLAEPLRRAGMERVNIHIDSLHPERLPQLMRLGNLDKIWAGIRAAEEAGMLPIKLNTVVTRGYNDQDAVDLARLTLERPWHVRFIELMPFAGPAEIALSNYVSTEELMDLLEADLGPLFPVNDGSLDGEARLYRLAGSRGTVGFISPVSNPYCGDCNRMRVTSDGRLRLCLLSDQEINFRDTLRNGGAQRDLVALFERAVRHKPWGHKLSEGVHPEARTMSQIGG